jgi:hypothetical protein
LSEFDPTTVDWGRVYVEALEIAHGLSRRNAEDLVQQGMTLVLEGTAPFDPDAGKTIAEHLVEVALTEARNRERIVRLRLRRGTMARLQHWMDAAPPTPEELNHTHKLGDAAYAALLTECEDDPDVRELVRLSREDVDEPADQAEQLKWDIERVRNARKRMNRMVSKVAESMQAWKEEDEP